MELYGQTFTIVIYSSVVGKIEIANAIYSDGSISTILWVIYPNGIGEKVSTLQEAYAKLEL
jgi:hypothetical protein